LTESAGKEDPATQPSPLRPPVEGSVGKAGSTYLRPKDSNAMVEVCDHATGKALEGADRQTDFTRIIVRFFVLLYISI